MSTVLLHPDRREIEDASQASSRSLRRVLLVSYHFPPVGGAGVQRPAKFVKYLRRFGWEASVLKAANPSVPVFDESLCDDLPGDLVVETARTREPGYRFKQNVAAENGDGKPSLVGRVTAPARRLVQSAAATLLQPDPQILWLPDAFRQGKRLLTRLPHEAIVATAPPYSSLLLGARLKRWSGLPLIVDFRDEWDLSSLHLENSAGNRFTRIVQRRLQKHVLRTADAVVATTQASAQRLQERVREAGGHAQAVCIHNGFDPSDFEGLTPAGWPGRPEAVRAAQPQEGPQKTGRDAHGTTTGRDRAPSCASRHTDNPEGIVRATRRDCFRLVYTGTLWNLTDVEPLVKAVERLAARNAPAAERLDLVVAGRKTDRQRRCLKRLSRTRCRLSQRDYCSHRQAVEQMASADALCLLLRDADGADRVVPAKLFEYLAAGKEILAVAPEGEAAEIVRRFYPENHFRPGDVEGLSRWLEDRAFGMARNSPVGGDSPEIAPFSRVNGACRLARLLDEAAVADAEAIRS